jgi:hypothetical protein
MSTVVIEVAVSLETLAEISTELWKGLAILNTCIHALPRDTRAGEPEVRGALRVADEIISGAVQSLEGLEDECHKSPWCTLPHGHESNCNANRAPP